MVDRAKPTNMRVKLNAEADVAADTYDVGYKKPPKATRFQKGRSGNPAGRPKGRKNFATELNAALNEIVVVTENHRRRKITKREAICRQLTNRSASGDMTALRLLVSLIGQIEAAEQGSETVFTPDLDRVLTQSLLARLGTMSSDTTKEP